MDQKRVEVEKHFYPISDNTVTNYLNENNNVVTQETWVNIFSKSLYKEQKTKWLSWQYMNVLCIQLLIFTAMTLLTYKNWVLEVSPEWELLMKNTWGNIRNFLDMLRIRRWTKKAYLFLMIHNSEEVDRDKIPQISFCFASLFLLYKKIQIGKGRTNMQSWYCR